MLDYNLLLSWRNYEKKINQVAAVTRFLGRNFSILLKRFLRISWVAQNVVAGYSFQTLAPDHVARTLYVEKYWKQRKWAYTQSGTRHSILYPLIRLQFTGIEQYLKIARKYTKRKQIRVGVWIWHRNTYIACFITNQYFLAVISKDRQPITIKSSRCRST